MLNFYPKMMGYSGGGGGGGGSGGGGGGAGGAAGGGGATGGSAVGSTGGSTDGGLKTNNLCGEGGRRAYRGSVFFDGRESVTATQVIAAEGNDDFTLGTGDFALEMWVYPTVVQSRTLYDGRRASSDNAMHIDLSSNVVRYMTNNNARITGSTALAVNSWHHISVERASGSTKLYVNGVQEGSTYSDTNNLVAKLNRPIIGSSYSMYSTFQGYISNLRLCKGHIVYGSNFTPPTSELTAHTESVLLCCQDSDDPLQEGTGKEMLGQGGCYRGRRFSNLATNGSLETGTTTNWNNGGCDTFEVSTTFSHSGDNSIHAITNSNGDAISYTIPVTLDTDKRYKISAYINVVGPGGTSARAKMKIGSGTGGNENYESEVVGQGNNGLGKWAYVEWIGLATADTTHVTFNESSSNNVNDYYVDDLRIELWYPEEGVNILGNPRFTSNSTGAATGWAFSSGNSPANEWSIANNKLTVTDTSRTNDAIASQQIFSQSIAEGRYRFTVDYSASIGDFDIGFGSRRLYGIRSTYNGGAGNNATVTYEVEADDNSSFRLVANQYFAGDFNSLHLSRVPEPIAPKVIPPYGVDAGNTFNGAISMNSPSYMCFPTGTTAERGRGRAVLMGGSIHPVSPSYTANIDYVEMRSSGVAVRFGSLTATTSHLGAFSSTTRGIAFGGQIASPDTQTNVIQFVTIATEGDATDFGDLLTAKRRLGGQGHSNTTRGITAGGGGDSPAPDNVIEFVTMATTGDSTNFGDLNERKDNSASTGSSTRMLIAGGRDYTPSATIVNKIEYITMATTGNVTDFGDLTAGRAEIGKASNGVRGLFVGGGTPTKVNTVDYITIATTGDAVDFGDIPLTTSGMASADNSIIGIFQGGNTPSRTSLMQSINIATTGDGSNYGDCNITSPLQGRAGCSDSHGGLS